MPSPVRSRSVAGWLTVSALASVVVLIAAMPSANGDSTVSARNGQSPSARTVTYHGYQVTVPSDWKVVDLATAAHACIRFDQPAVYVGTPGDQSQCPPHLIGGAPGLLIEPLDYVTASGITTSAVPPTPGGGVRPGALPGHGPVSMAIRSASVLVTAVYGPRSAAVAGHILTGGHVLATARRLAPGAPVEPATAPGVGASVPGTYLGLGFDVCAAPSQSAMDAWLGSGDYGAVGVYIGGVSRGCAQPNLTASWVSEQVSEGWHLIPTYVGLQAPCTDFYNTMSSDPATAKEQGLAEAADAVTQAKDLGMAAPSTVYSDIEGYNNTIHSCVAAVLSYVSGWTRGLHEAGYEAGIYSSASSGMRDLSASYTSTLYNRPDDIWMAWWNYLADADGGGYVPASQWSLHQRIHQYVGAVWEAHGGYNLDIDRDFLDVTTAVSLPRGCPTNLDFSSYRVLRALDHGEQVLATQCQLARRGFDPGAATGMIRWRTAAAISAFNTSRGLADRAVVGRRSWTAMLSGGKTRLLVLGAAGPVVSKIQRALSASLKINVPDTGVFDRPTRRAVLNYQRAHGLTVDGTASRATWAALQAGV